MRCTDKIGEAEAHISWCLALCVCFQCKSQPRCGADLGAARWQHLRVLAKLLAAGPVCAKALQLYLVCTACQAALGWLRDWRLRSQQQLLRTGTQAFEKGSSSARASSGSRKLTERLAGVCSSSRPGTYAQEGARQCGRLVKHRQWSGNSRLGTACARVLGTDSNGSRYHHQTCRAAGGRRQAWEFQPSSVST